MELGRLTVFFDLKGQHHILFYACIVKKNETIKKIVHSEQASVALIFFKYQVPLKRGKFYQDTAIACIFHMPRQNTMLVFKATQKRGR